MSAKSYESGLTVVFTDKDGEPRTDDEIELLRLELDVVARAHGFGVRSWGESQMMAKMVGTSIARRCLDLAIEQVEQAKPAPSWSRTVMVPTAIENKPPPFPTEPCVRLVCAVTTVECDSRSATVHLQGRDAAGGARVTLGPQMTEALSKLDGDGFVVLTLSKQTM